MQDRVVKWHCLLRSFGLLQSIKWQRRSRCVLQPAAPLLFLKNIYLQGRRVPLNRFLQKIICVLAGAKLKHAAAC